MGGAVAAGEGDAASEAVLVVAGVGRLDAGLSTAIGPQPAMPATRQPDRAISQDL
jgi:hypothetical protein